MHASPKFANLREEPIDFVYTREPCFSFKSLACKTARLTPRLVIGGLAGYYILGYAYMNGWMAAIDQFVMQLMRDHGMGYIAIGALMPQVQWWASRGVQVSGAFIAALAYDLAERVMIYSISFFNPEPLQANILPI